MAVTGAQRKAADGARSRKTKENNDCTQGTVTIPAANHACHDSYRKPWLVKALQRMRAQNAKDGTVTAKGAKTPI